MTPNVFNISVYACLIFFRFFPFIPSISFFLKPLQTADLVAIETPDENEMIRSWAHSYRKDHIIIGGQWNRSNGVWEPIWVGTNKTMTYRNFYTGQGNNGASGGQYFYMMPPSGNGQWGDYSGGTEAFVCEAGEKCQVCMNVSCDL